MEGPTKSVLRSSKLSNFAAFTDKFDRFHAFPENFATLLSLAQTLC